MARLELSAVETNELAAQGGAVDALFELGIMYATGREVTTDLIAAHKFFNLAAMRGNSDAKRYRMEISREMDKRQIAEAQKRAREWLRKH
jgi:uncharacterized protein